MADSRLTQTRIRSLAGVPSLGEETTQGRIRALEDAPAPEAFNSHSRVRTMAGGAGQAQISQGRVRVLYTGRIDTPYVRAWTFTLDGHDFYVL